MAVWPKRGKTVHIEGAHCAKTAIRNYNKNAILNRNKKKCSQAFPRTYSNEWQFDQKETKVTVLKIQILRVNY